MKSALQVCFAWLVLAQASAPVAAQLVPEGIHTTPSGPLEMCGIRGRDLGDYIAALRASAAHRPEAIGSDRFELYVAKEGWDQIVLTRPAEPAHPAATCRHAYRDAEGNIMMERHMRCDASREACDRLFLEFQALDERMRQEIATRTGH